MENWQQRARKHLGACQGPREIRDEVVVELAAHLEETYEEARATGLTEVAAMKLTLKEVDDWRVLARNIHRAKSQDLMNHRTKSLWLPGLATFLGASLSRMLCQFFGVQPRIVLVGKIPMCFY